MKINTEHFKLLGLEVEDKVTGFKGVVTSLSYDLYGCIQVVITPAIDKDGKHGNSQWYDITRLKIIGTHPVIERPDYSAGYIGDGKKGAADKPIPN